MIRRFDRFACIDWSGARGERLVGIAVAACDAGDEAPRLLAPPGGGLWSRPAVLDWLGAQAADDLLVGIDFSASFPFVDAGAFFPGHPDGPTTAHDLWALVDTISRDDPHLGAASFVEAFAPWFRVGAATGARFPAPGLRNGRLRVVERQAGSGAPTSCFNLVGPSQVGLSSLTGMRLLHRLAPDVAIWPFDPVPPAGLVLTEIYTSIAARAAGRPRGRSKMTSGEALDTALTSPAIASRAFGRSGPIDDHSSDAILTAAWLRRAASDAALWRPPPPVLAQTEGWTFGVPCRREMPGPA